MPARVAGSGMENDDRPAGLVERPRQIVRRGCRASRGGRGPRRRPEDYKMELWDSIVDVELGSVFARGPAV
jgi:hypothetical protein